MVAVSNSEIATWDRCRRQWYLKYYLGMVPEHEAPYSNQWLGTRIHSALEGLYGYQMDPVHTLNLLYALAVQENPDDRIELLKEREMAVIMVEGYLEWIESTAKDAGLIVIATEQDITVPFPKVPGVALRGRMDQVAWDEETQTIRFVDHKTAPDFAAHELLSLNPQFKFYSILQRLAPPPYGQVVMGGMMNTLRRVKRTAKSKPPYYLRDSVWYTDEQLDSAEARVTKLCMEIRDARASLDYVYTEGGGLLEYVNQVQRLELPPSPRVHECRWDCPFLTLCPMMDDGSDWPGMLTRSGRFRQDDPYSYYAQDPLKAIRAGMSEGGDRTDEPQPERSE